MAERDARQHADRVSSAGFQWEHTMTLRKRLLRIGLALLGLVIVLGIAVVIVVQTNWFRNYVRQKIITATEEGTGGRVEIESFAFSPRRLEALVTNFVIHGKDPADAAPWIRAARVQVNIRLFTSLRRILDISYLGVEQPQANIMVFADGTTNIPEPKKKPEPNTTVLDTVIDLAVDRFLISNGMLTLNSQPQANIMVFADGTTNIPEPKKKPEPNTTVLD